MSCEHTMDVSALLDGELAPADAPTLVEHLLACAPCATFFRRARSLEAAVLLATAEDDATAVAPAPAPPAVWERIERATRPGATARPRRRSLPSWAVGAAAAGLLVVGVLLGWQLAASGRRATGTAAVTLQAREGLTLTSLAPSPSMDETRFVAIARELLAAEPRYHDAMAGVLAVARSGEAREGSTAESAWREEELRDLHGEQPTLH
jgi:anti-sigma factor RsiW